MIKERIKEIITDIRQVGIEGVLYQQDLRSRYPEVRVFDQRGAAILKGLLVDFNEEFFVVRERASYGYVEHIQPNIGKFRIVTKDGTEITPDLLRDLIE